jgi:hypothetical protein
MEQVYHTIVRSIFFEPLVVWAGEVVAADYASNGCLGIDIYVRLKCRTMN